MSSYQCCDCGEIKASKSDLEAHINSDHIGWSPYQCFYCSQHGISTRKPNKQMLREHVTLRHPDEELTFLCTDHHIDNEHLKDMLHRSTVHGQSPDMTFNTQISVNAASKVGNVSPLVMSLSSTSPHPQIKVEDIDVEKFLGPHIITINDDVESVAETTDKNSDAIKANINILENCRCETCLESVPRNLQIIRDHVKLHFKEKTGCVPDDLTNLLPKLQFVYCQLLLNSFPSVGASILCDDETKLEESDKIGLTQVQNTKEQHNQFSHANKDPKSTTRMSQTTTADCHPPIGEVSAGKEVSCHVCGQKFVSMISMLKHRTRKHEVAVKWYCTQCNIDISQSGGDSGYSAHLLHVHLGKRTYECSQCGKSIKPGMMKDHDKRFHGGSGRSQLFNNLHRYKLQLEALRKKMIIDQNASLNSKKKIATSRKPRKKLKLRHDASLSTMAPVKANCQFSKEMPTDDSINCAKSAPKHAKTTDLSCEICNEKFASKFGMRIHRSRKHGIVVKWHCKQCNINLACHAINAHLLKVHMGKQHYVCSLCGKSISCHSLFGIHDKNRHDGLGKARFIRNHIRYQKEIKELRNKFIIDVNSKVGTPEINSVISQSNNDPKLISDVKAISVLCCEICNETLPSLSGLKSHRYNKHGILVKKFCKKCNIDLQLGYVNGHLLSVHIGKKKPYECSLCKMAIRPYKRDHHDRQYHGGKGKTQIVNYMNLYRSQVEALRNKLIIDLNASSYKLEEAKKLHATCGICSQTFLSMKGLMLHRYHKHGISVKWHCKRCNINVLSNKVNMHLLTVHIEKKPYECSLCKSSVPPGYVNQHDKQVHGGLGKALILSNINLYSSQVAALHKKLIINLNASSTSSLPSMNSEK